MEEFSACTSGKAYVTTLVLLQGEALHILQTPANILAKTMLQQPIQ